MSEHEKETKEAKHRTDETARKAVEHPIETSMKADGSSSKSTGRWRVPGILAALAIVILLLLVFL